jgi:S1-C subfamily serine protease
VLADLAEKTNRRLQAESTFATIAERYARLDVLYEFYARQVQAGHTGFAAKRDAVFARVFPNGFESVASLTASPPADGVLLRSVERDGQREGLRYGDIVVALDGIRTHSPTQLRIVALRGTDPKMQLAVFRRGVYLEIVCEFKDRHLPAEAVSYPQER